MRKEEIVVMRQQEKEENEIKTRIDRVDYRFDEIISRSIKREIVDAFLDLETNIRVGIYQTKEDLTDFDKRIVNEKANQMKKEINSFIDSQVERIIGPLSN